MNYAAPLHARLRKSEKAAVARLRAAFDFQDPCRKGDPDKFEDLIDMTIAELEDLRSEYAVEYTESKEQ